MTKQTQFHIKSILAAAVAAASVSGGAHASVSDITKALTDGKAYGDFRLRYERVEQDNPVNDAGAMTLRSRLGYTTGAYEGLSATMEFEDSRTVAGFNEYELPGPARPSDYVVKSKSVIADPETTELDQAFLQYKNDQVTAKIGRQVLTLDNHRFVGHVGWRQDRQTFDALSVKYVPMDGLDVTYAHLYKRNRIFGEQADVKSKDHLLNVGYKTPFGKASGYAYLLEVDNDTDNGLDTYGVRFAGGKELDSGKVLYTAEFAYQERTAGSNTTEANYRLLEGGFSMEGITAKLGYEVLGAKDHAFSTPLATLHKFNGWTDQFLGTPDDGLVDMYLSLSGKLGGGKWVLAYHDFSASKDNVENDDLGSEIDVLYAKKFNDNYSAGIKYGMYSAGDIKVDTDKLWFWVGAKF